jgi:[acyl-carrier-protein] S-malonyltransferase
MSQTALLFAGQGAQVVGMGRDLAAAFPTAKALAERADAALAYRLSDVCFSGPDSELTRTENAQPGIYLVSWIAFQLLRERIPSLAFQATAGLSLGEFTALAAAEVFSFEQGLNLVRQRGRFMQEACEQTQGSMAAIIGLEIGPTRETCAEAGVELANLNCPGQLVISGAQEAILRACDLAKARGARRALPLPVAGAYHSRLMSSAQPKLRDQLEAVPFAAPKVPVIANVTGQFHGGPSEIKQRLVEQVTGSVLWEAGIRQLLSQGFTRFIELGPGTALAGFMKRIDKNARVWSIGDVQSLETAVRELGG